MREFIDMLLEDSETELISEYASTQIVSASESYTIAEWSTVAKMNTAETSDNPDKRPTF